MIKIRDFYLMYLLQPRSTPTLLILSAMVQLVLAVVAYGQLLVSTGGYLALVILFMTVECELHLLL